MDEIKDVNDKELLRCYDAAAERIKEALLRSQYQALRSTNSVQLQMYYSIGRYISLNSRDEVWGSGALSYISEWLSRNMPGLRGFSETNLRMMRLFYEQWNFLDINSSTAVDEMRKGDSSTAVDEIGLALIGKPVQAELRDFPLEEFLQVPFSHQYIILSKVKDLEERYFYLRLCVMEHLSREGLKKAIEGDEYHHRGTLPNNFGESISSVEQARKAVLAFKDEYVLDFINVEELGARDIEDVDERIVEQEIVQNIKNFIMTFGRDFAFLGNQYKVEAMGHTHYIDLLFYNRELSCLIAVELKTGAFKTSYLGQLNGYLSVLDDYVRKPMENRSIGVLLCKSVDRNYAEYMVRGYDNPMGVATFKTAGDMPDKLRRALPDIEELKRLL